MAHGSPQHCLSHHYYHMIAVSNVALVTCNWKYCADQVFLDKMKGHWPIAFVKAEGMAIKMMINNNEKLKNGNDNAWRAASVNLGSYCCCVQFVAVEYMLVAGYFMILVFIRHK